MTRTRNFVRNLIGETGKAKAFFFISFLFVLILCLLMIHDVWIKSVNDTKEDTLKLASVAEAGIIKDNISQLEINETDLTKKAYIETKNSLRHIVKAHQDIRFAYILVLKDGEIYFAVDSEPAISKDYSPPGQKYSELTDEAYRPFRDGQPRIINNKDRWGNWITVLIPMRDPVTGKILALYGIDYPEEIWYRYAYGYTRLASLIAVCIILLHFSGVAVIRANISLQREKKKLSETNEKLKKEQELFRTVFEQSPMGIFISSGGSVDHNYMYRKIVGRPSEEIDVSSWESFTHPSELPNEIAEDERLKSGEISSYKMNKRYIKPDGDTVWANITVTPLKLGNKDENDYLCIVEDITERVKAEKELLESERSHSILLSNLPGMAYRCKNDGNWTMMFVSEGCLELTGYPSASLINNKIIAYSDLINLKYKDSSKWADAIKNRAKLSEEYEITTASGKTKWVLEQGQAIYDEAGNVEALEGLIIDISDRKKKEDEIIFLNNHDFLTGIHNRRHLEYEKLRMDNEDFLPLSIIIGDINGVKLVNDAFGHAAGDILIQETAKIIQGCCRDSDIVARTGGDEFVIFMPWTDLETANEIKEKIKEKCGLYNKDLSNDAYSINISLGYSTKENVNEDLDAVTKLAEDYMYKQKLLEHKSSHSVILSSIKATMYEKSHETQEHADRLTCLSKELGKKMKLSQQALDELELVATLHDIGKVGIDDRILNKPGKLSEEEWVEMKKHSEIGYRIAMSSPDLVPIAEYILSLH